MRKRIGKEAPIPAAAAPEKRFDQAGDGQLLVSTNFNPSPAVAAIVFEVIALIIVIVFIIWSNSLHYYDKYYDQKSLFTVLGVIAVNGSILALIFKFIALGVNSQLHCSAYENRIYGRCSHSRWAWGGSDFELNYSDIESVTAERYRVTIISQGKQYIVPAANELQANQLASVIRDRKENGNSRRKEFYLWKCNECGQLNSMNANRCTACKEPKANGTIIENANQPAFDEWLCPGCGRINKNYIIACGCGTEKPKSPKAPVSQKNPEANGNWICMKCRFINPSIVTRCVKCGEKKN